MAVRPVAGCGRKFCIPLLVTSDIPLVLRKVLMDSNEAEHLPSWSLEVQVGVWRLNDSDAGIDDLLSHCVDVIGLEFQVN